MKSPIHILHLEDDPKDANLIKRTLLGEGVHCAITCVKSRDEFVAALERGDIDLILSDGALPTFDGMSALKIAHDKWPAIPLIFVSGTMGEQRAIDSLRNGATDYILKENLSRMTPAVCRAMQEVEVRTASRRTEEALRESDQRLRTVFSEAPLGIALVGVDGRPVLTNKVLEKMLGYTGEELRRMSFTEFTHAEDCAKDWELYQQLIQGTRQGYQLEKRYLRKDGQLVWARLSVILAREKAGHANFAIAMVEDMTESRRLEAQFIEAQKMEVVGHLASGVAHDFNNLLAVIMGYSDLMLMETNLSEAFQSKLECIREAAERAAGLTRQLLIFSRKQIVELVVLNINEVIKDLDKMLHRLIDEHIKLTIVLGQDVGRIKADSGYMGQVAMNLVVNARDAMPDGGLITIGTGNVTLDEHFASTHAGAIPGDYVLLSVSDTGSGMTEEVKARIFEAFFTTKPKGKGTGLGLATCQTIVQQTGGFIEVQSEIGRGTTFKIYFPCVDQPLDVVAGAHAAPAPLGTETLVVAEDDPSLRRLTCKILQAQGYEVLTAANGQDALLAVRNHKGQPIRLVITDVIMPVMGGVVLAEWLKSANPDLKILFTSGYTDDAFAHSGGLETGFAFLSKPYSPKTLCIKVREMLGSAQTRR